MIITPQNDPQLPSREEQEQIELNQKRYESDPELKALADHIHHARMMSGDACPQCICIALSRLENKKEINRE